MANEKTRTSGKLTSAKIQKLVGIGLMTAIVVVVYFLTMQMAIGPFNFTLALFPIVVGAALYGWKTGGWLGLVFSIMVLATGGANAFLVVNVPGTIITVLVKGTAAGLVSGIVYTALEKKNRWAAAFCAAAVAPIVNTGIFLIGCIAFFMDTLSEWATGFGFANAWLYMILGLTGGNFLIEFVTNMILASVIVRVIDILKNKLSVNRSQGA